MILSFVSASPTKSKSVLPCTQPLFRRVESQTGDWSDEEGVGTSSSGEAPKDLESALHRVKALEANLNKAKQDLANYREFVTKSLDVEKRAEGVASSSAIDPTVPKRDDDSHYFTSYSSNGTCYLLTPYLG